MGHYDDFYAADAERERKRRREEAEKRAKEADLPVLLGEKFKFAPIGVCASCAQLVYCVPNWGCSRGRNECPLRPVV